MKKLNLLRLLFGTMLVFAATAFTSCVDDNDDTEAPYLEVSPATLAFDTNGQAADGDSFVIKTNRHWTATLNSEAATWITLSKYEGDGNSTVTVSIPAGSAMSGTVEVAISNQLGVLKSIPVTITRGEVLPEEVIYSETCGTVTVSNPWPLVGAYTDWNTTGSGADEVTYSGTNTSVRSSGLANKGSGPNVIFFGTAPASVTVNKITLTAEQTNLRLTFLGSYSYKPEGAPDYDNTFDPSKFTVALSADGTSWTDITYTKDDGDTATPYWVTATADFTLTKAVANLYIRFTATASSAFRLDDIKLVTGNGGQSVDLDGGVTPPDPTDAIFLESFGAGEKVNGNWAYIDQYSDYSKQGDGYVEGTTAYAGSSASVRTNSYNSNPVPPFSGAGHVWFPKNGGSYTVSKLILTSAQTKLQLSLGVVGGDDSGKEQYDPSTNNLKIEVSANGTNWTAVTPTYQVYTGEKCNWSLATADFTLKNAVTNFYIRVSGSALRIDDVKLAEGAGGTVIDLDSDTPDPGEPTLVSIAAANEKIAAAYEGKTGKQTFTENIKVQGLVISDKAGGNINDNAFIIQDASTAGSGLYVSIYGVGDGTHDFVIGDKVELVLYNSIIQDYNGLMQVYPAAADEYKKTGTGTPLAAVPITVADMGKYQSMYVSIADVKPVASFIGQTYFSDTNKGTVMFQNAAATEFAVYTKSSCVNASTVIPDKTGTLKGIVGKYNVDQIQPRNASDIALDSGGATDPVVTTVAYSEVTGVSFKAGGSVAGTEVSALTAVGIQYIEFAEGTIDQLDWTGATKVSAETIAASWTANVTGLTKETQYAYRAYATTAAGDYFGSAMSVVTTSSSGVTTPITIPDLLQLAVNDPVSTTDDRVLTAVVCGDPTGNNFSFGTLYVMTEGAKAAGNGIVIYNSKSAEFDTSKYALGDKLKITLKANVAMMAAYQNIRQITGVTDADIVKDGTAAVEPVEVTPAQLTEYVSMPVTVKDASVAKVGVWFTTATTSHDFMAGGASFVVSVNARATTFKNVPYAAVTGNITGIATLFSGKGQVAPRNLNDVKAFELTTPYIYDYSPKNVEFLAAGGSQDVELTVFNAGANAITATGLAAPFSASVDGSTVKVSTTVNASPEAIPAQTLTISIAGGNQVTMQISQLGAGATVKKYVRVTSAPADWSGTYLIAYVADKGTTAYVLDGKRSSATLGEVAEVTTGYDSDTDSFTSNAEIDAMAVTVAAADGGNYSIYVAKAAQYIGWTSGNNLAFSDSASDNKYNWTLAPDAIANAATPARILQYNTGSPRFACYTGSQKNAFLYKLTE